MNTCVCIHARGVYKPLAVQRHPLKCGIMHADRKCCIGASFTVWLNCMHVVHACRKLRVMAAYVPSSLQPLCVTLPCFFREHLDALAHRGVRTHEPHATTSSSTHTVPTSVPQQHNWSENILQTPEASMNLPDDSMDCATLDADITPHSTLENDVLKHSGGDMGTGDVTMHERTGRAPPCLASPRFTCFFTISASLFELFTASASLLVHRVGDLWSSPGGAI